jgi:hypothetical protein
VRVGSSETLALERRPGQCTMSMADEGLPTVNQLKEAFCDNKDALSGTFFTQVPNTTVRVFQHASHVSCSKAHEGIFSGMGMVTETPLTAGPRSEDVWSECLSGCLTQLLPAQEL